MRKSVLDVTSVALAMLPVIGMLYHRLRRQPNFALSVVFLALAMVSGGLFSMVVEQGRKDFVLVQVLIVVPVTIWGFRPKVRARIAEGAREVLRWYRRLVTPPPWDFPDHRPDESREETRLAERDNEE